MKNLVTVFVAICFVFAFATIGHAGAVKGEITKMSGDMVDVKDSEGKMHAIHVDPKSTKKDGKLKVGAMVEADVNDMGHANSIKVEGMMDMKGDMKGGMKDDMKK